MHAPDARLADPLDPQRPLGPLAAQRVAAAVLGMTSLAMGDAVNMIGVTSYGLVTLLGAYLIIRKLFL